MNQQLLSALTLSLLAPGLLWGATADSQQVDPGLTQVVEENEQVAPAGNAVEISSGHVDIAPRLRDASVQLMVRDDASETPTWRNIDDVVFRVTDVARLQIPQDDPNFDFIDATEPVWVVPQNEISNVVWLGWNTQDPKVVSDTTGSVSMTFMGHEGPGDFYAFVQAGNFQGPQQLWNSTLTQAQPLHVEVNTHTHANWVFTEPGIHLLRLSVQMQLADGSNVEDTQVLKFAVGDSADAEQALAKKWSAEFTPEELAEETEVSAVDNATSVPLMVGAGLLVLALGVAGTAVALRGRAMRDRRAAQAEMTEGEA